MTVVYRTAQPVDWADSYRQLRALRVVAGQGWADYTAAEARWGRHQLTLPDGTVRVLLRGEPYWWGWGLASGWGLGHLIGRLSAEEVPELWTLPQTAGELTARTGERTTVEMVDYRIRTGDLYPLYGPRLVRKVFAAQVVAVAATAGATTAARARALRRHWSHLAERLPARLPPTVLPAPPPPGMLPIMVGKPEATRRLQALIIADAAGWLRLDHPLPTGGGFVVYLPDAHTPAGGFPVRVELPAPGVLPYVLGLADRFGQAARVAYRAGLTDV